VKTSVAYDYRDMSKMAAKMVADAIRARPNLVLGLATGGTPLGMYKELIRMHIEEGLDFSQVTTFNLDEFCGISPDNKHSYRYYMCQNFFNHVNVKPENIYIPDGKGRRYRRILQGIRQKDRGTWPHRPANLGHGQKRTHRLQRTCRQAKGRYSCRNAY